MRLVRRARTLPTLPGPPCARTLNVLAAVLGALLLLLILLHSSGASLGLLLTSSSLHKAKAAKLESRDHALLMAEHLYGVGMGGQLDYMSYLHLLDDARLAPLTKLAQQWIWQQQHPDPASCTQQRFVVGITDLYNHGLGASIHTAGEALSAALQTGRLLVYAKDHGEPFADPGCGRGEPHSNLYCLLEAPSACGPQHVTPGNSLEYALYHKEGQGFPAGSGEKFQTGVPPYLLERLRVHVEQHMGSELTPEFAKYWWRAQSAAYLARPNKHTKAKLAAMRRDPGMFVRLTGAAAAGQQGEAGEGQEQQQQQQQQRLRVPFPLPAGTIRMHVRHGDKGQEMKLVPLDDYLRAAEHVVNTNPLFYRKVAFLTSDDADVFKQAAKVTRMQADITSQDRDWVLWSVKETSQTTNRDKGWHAEFQGGSKQEAAARHLLSIFIGLESDAWVGSRGSNWDRLMDELRCVWVDKCSQPFLEIGPHSNWAGYSWR